MGTSMGYSIAAWAAYNLPQSDLAGGGISAHREKKIFAIESGSALGFPGIETETMARFSTDIFIISGIYHGDTASVQQ